eukprot:CAMPEP_0201575826 /NCGR_PEP_ID=MMETSP0190_2-20130828/21243_1 /ASSEMBLY_ACC=CAM_ASM_000263 /TAXON_ID=37353 /ORGANISM="Rosalina sp." /LENGTH=42 /DNA_ID= /DNA_START= /DNA_END= /DNA_ORIENTATION=
MAEKKEGATETPGLKEAENLSRSTMIERNARVIDVITMMEKW